MFWIMSLPARTCVCVGGMSLSTESRLQQWIHLTFIVLRHCGTLNLPSPREHPYQGSKSIITFQPQDPLLSQPNTNPSTQPAILPSRVSQQGRAQPSGLVDSVIWMELERVRRDLGMGSMTWKDRCCLTVRWQRISERTLVGPRRELLVGQATSPHSSVFLFFGREHLLRVFQGYLCPGHQHQPSLARSDWNSMRRAVWMCLSSFQKLSAANLIYYHICQSPTEYSHLWKFRNKRK